ncbi:glycosyltransferase [Cyclobacterium plantarum]|uniref:Glycosyltransferase family 2 protein n=1 Tax=Cyclobacterium plantarum TaxID=2716263 RepID=A0ABX0H8E6_9BACT|nr:glycosyltransferase family A protein [Cyclobacterium plantarum]NHE56240.1 glycosyltransferase family 2 protein [Cyclobacterium plantarum]
MCELYFSVVIPVYNDKVRLEKCLDALIRQRFDQRKFEVIVVNNDPDGSIVLDDQYYNKLNLELVNEISPGSYSARNKGIQCSNAEIIAFTDSDCIPDSDWLSNAMQYFENDYSRINGIVAGKVPLFFINPNSMSFAEIYEKYTGFDFESYVKEGSCGAGNWFSYKSVLTEFGGFNSQLKSNGDTELSKRISKKYNIIFAPDVIVSHPSRYLIKDIVYKYRRLLGGTYNRKFENSHKGFLFYMISFSWRRLRFAIKKIFIIHPKESVPIFFVCLAIIIGTWKEYILLLQGNDAKR